MNEELSALIDGELNSGLVNGALGRVRADTRLRSSWDTYHLIGDALRGQICADIAASVLSRLEREPTVLAPGRIARPVKHTVRYAMSAAAGVAAVILVIWTAAPLWKGLPELGQGAAQSTARSGTEGPPPVAELTLEPQALPAGAVENYLLAHQPYSHASAMQGIAPYVRAVSAEDREGRK